MRAILNKIFLQKLGYTKFILSGIGYVCGLTLVLLSLQSYLKIEKHLSPKQNASSYLIINKEVVMANTLFGSSAKFSGEELKELREQKFVDEMGTFTTNTYEVMAFAGGDLGDFRTELFFESINTKFLDSPPRNFRWEQGSEFLPIIISQDFIDLYNFGYSLGKGTPQLSKSTVLLVPLKILIAGEKGRKVFDARIVGFSERIGSVLVPESFMSWANENVGNVAEQKVSRVMIKVRDDGAPALSQYLESHKLIVSNEKMKFSKILSTLQLLMGAVTLIGTLFILFSLVIVIMNFSIVVAQAKEEISLLLQLGYRQRQITRQLTLYLIIFILIVSAITMVFWLVSNGIIVALLTTHGLETSKSPEELVVILSLAFTLISFLISWLFIRRLIERQSS